MDLGKNALSIYAAYGTTVLLFAALILLSVHRARKTTAKLAALEAKQNA